MSPLTELLFDYVDLKITCFIFGDFDLPEIDRSAAAGLVNPYNASIHVFYD